MPDGDRHSLVYDDDFDESSGAHCVHCGIEPWMESFAAPCPGPHPDLAQRSRRRTDPPDVQPGFTVRHPFRLLVVLAAVSAAEAWAMWRLLR